jgi:hypothetical protein
MQLSEPAGSAIEAPEFPVCADPLAELLLMSGIPAGFAVAGQWDRHSH